MTLGMGWRCDSDTMVGIDRRISYCKSFDTETTSVEYAHMKFAFEMKQLENRRNHLHNILILSWWSFEYVGFNISIGRIYSVVHLLTHSFYRRLRHDIYFIYIYFFRSKNFQFYTELCIPCCFFLDLTPNLSHFSTVL